MEGHMAIGATRLTLNAKPVGGDSPGMRSTPVLVMTKLQCSRLLDA